MTVDTEKLIERMAAIVEPVRPLARPWIRTAAWLLVAIPYVALVVSVLSPRADLISKASEWRYMIEQFAALATGITAATAAFATIIPGYDRKFLFVPALPLAIWLATLGDGCVEDWIHFGPDGLSLQTDLLCFPAVVLGGAVPAIAMAIMLRRGAPLTPHITSARRHRSQQRPNPVNRSQPAARSVIMFKWPALIAAIVVIPSLAWAGDDRMVAKK